MLNRKINILTLNKTRIRNFQFNSIQLYLSTAFHSGSRFKAALQEMHVLMIKCNLAPIKWTHIKSATYMEV